jgi:hypothetical protein
MKTLIRVETGIWVDIAEAEAGDQLEIEFKVLVSGVQKATTLNQEQHQIVHAFMPHVLKTSLTRNHWGKT